MEFEANKENMEQGQNLDAGARWLNIFLRDGLLGKIAKIVALAFSLFHLYTGFFGILSGTRQRVVHLMFGLALIFLSGALSRTPKKTLVAVVQNFAFLLLALTAGIWYLTQEYALSSWRMGIVYPGEMVLGTVLIILILDATRRMVGWALPIVAIVSLLYAKFGNYLPGLLEHAGFSMRRIISQIYLTGEGIWGPTMGVSATYLFVYILFGVFLSASGAGKAFADLALAFVGRFRGGSAKLSVVSSALMGTVSGSAVANVMITGVISIPLMKRTGFRDYVAGAVEAAASTGGQIMPPVMGAAAFMMVEFTGISYGTIAGAAIVPALLYFLGIGIMVDLEAARVGIRGLPRDQIPPLLGVLKRFWLPFVPLVGLIYALIIADLSPMKAGVLAIVLTFMVWFLSPIDRITLSRLLAALENGALAVLPVVTTVATAGIVIGMINLTGIGLKISSLILEASGGNLFLLMLFTMLVSLLLGMGLPTVATYMILALLVAPTMVQMGVPMLSAHLFVFYFGVLACVTPPVAIAAYAGAGLAGSNPMRTGLEATKLAIVGFIIPYMFVLQPKMLLGTVWFRMQSGLTGALGVVGLAACLYGFLFSRINWVERLILLASAFGLLFPEIYTDLIGAILILGIGIKSYLKHRHTWKVDGM